MRMPSDARETQLFTYAAPHAALDEVNVRILEELRRDPRLTMTALGRRIGMSPPAVSDPRSRLSETGIICCHRLDRAPRVLGLPLTVHSRTAPHPGRLSRGAELAFSIPEVVECHRITGEDCFLLKEHVPAIDQFDRLLDQFLIYGTTT